MKLWQIVFCFSTERQIIYGYKLYKRIRLTVMSLHKAEYFGMILTEMLKTEQKALVKREITFSWLTFKIYLFSKYGSQTGKASEIKMYIFQYWLIFSFFRITLSSQCMHGEILWDAFHILNVGNYPSQSDLLKDGILWLVRMILRLNFYFGK